MCGDYWSLIQFFYAASQQTAQLLKQEYIVSITYNATVVNAVFMSLRI